MRLKVVTQLRFGDEDGIQELLDLEVAGLVIGQDLTNVVYGTLHFEGVSLFFLLYHQGGADHLRGGRDVEQKGFSLGGRNYDWGLCQELFNHVKCFLGLGCPFE